MRFALAFAIPPLLFIAGLMLATGFIAGVFEGHPALGAPLLNISGEPVYSPFAVISWTEAHAEDFPKPFAIARLCQRRDKKGPFAGLKRGQSGSIKSPACEAGF